MVSPSSLFSREPEASADSAGPRLAAKRLALRRRRDFGGALLPGDGLLRRLGDNTEQTPVLGFRQRPRFHDLDRVTDVRFIGLVVDLADGPALDVLAVAGMLDQAWNLHPSGLVHLVASDHADGHASLATLCWFGHRYFAPGAVLDFCADNSRSRIRVL